MKENNPFKRCDVCGSKGNLNEMMSSLAPVLINKCLHCVDAEPYNMLIAAISGVQDKTHFQSVINATLKATRKTEEILERDIQQYLREEL